jgi:hypothetical protein
MTEKPSYLGLLNAIAVGERGGEELFEAWACATSDEDVRCVLRTVALREGEHARSFAKRIDELGYSVLDRPDPELPGRVEIARSTTLTDREKFERLGFHRDPGPGPDAFARFFEDTTMDIETGTLMGRYVSEERDTGRRLRACYTALVARDADLSTSATIVSDLSARLDRIECALAELVEATSGGASKPAGGSNGSAKKGSAKN